MRESCIHQVFAQRVRERPDSEAVCGWDQQFSYSELDTLSSRLAFRLVSLNVGSEVLVPLCFEKSAWTIVAMMAVLKAGGAFVPLDPSYPVKRLEQIIRQAGANLILTSPQYTDLCRPLTRTLLPVCSSTFDELPAPSDAAPFSSQPRSAAYVIFTSGSTGRPKGVVVEHRAFCACAVAHGPAHRIESTSRVLQFASYSFDASLVEILTTLMSGGCCCVPSATDRVNDLARAMHELRVDLAILTPTVAALLAPKAIPQLKTLVMIGETMKKSQIRDWADIPHLLCAYGPTEASVSATVNSRVTEAAGPANLGVPVGCHIWITDPDDHNRLLPKGEIGEALIEGPNLARGYLNDPERTRAAFIDDTTWQKPGQRFYKTGDLMRRNVDGTLDFVGRKDMQIKIRGQRVETEEIEQCLAGEDGVSQTAVVWPNSGPYACRLVGIVCLETLSNKMVDSKDLRLLRGAESVKAQECLSRLMARAEVSLPSFMVPAVILPVEAIPLLLSGKVNRAQIIEWIGSLDDETSLDIQTRKDDRDRLTARTKLGLTISQIWAKVLNIPSDQILLDKSFLSYGGDSVSAIQVVSKCREKGMKLAVQDILKWKTISRLLPHLPVQYTLSDFSKARLTYGSLDTLAKKVSSPPGMTANVDIEDIYPCSPMQQGILISQAKGSASYNTHTMWEVESSPGSQRVDMERLEHAWRQVVSRHPCLRTIFVENVTANESFHQVVLKNIEVKVAKRQWESKSLELHHLCGELNGQAQLPLQFTIYEAENGRVFSSLNISHLVMDGLSIDNIVRDILLAYDDRLPPAPASSYGDYISLVRGQTDTKSLQFWKVRLADLEPCLFPRLEVGSEMKKELRSMRSMIPPSQAKKLWEFCEKENYTMSTLFQLAWAIVLQSYVGTDDVCFGYLVSGRDVPLPGIEDLVGAFSNVLICRTDLSKVDSISSALGSMQTDALMCLEHEFCSLGDVHNALGVPALFNTIISYQRHEVSKVAVKSSIEFEKIGDDELTLFQYDLAVGVHVFDGKIFVKMDYQSELLSRGHSEHIIDTLNTVLSAFVNSPSQDIRTVNRISNKGRDAILSFTAPELERSTECIHSAIKQQVAYCPEASAIEAWDVSFSYAKLYNISFLVAKDLLDIGLGPQMVVPLLFEKSGWTTVAMLAVMLAGGIFVLLDPSHPRARLEEIIAQLSPTIVISSRQQKKLASSFIETVFEVGPDIVERSREPEKITIADNLRSTDAAFIIFTSGSTGKPKGVVIEHGAFVSAAKAHSGPLEMTNSSRVLQFASYSFDACLLEILTTLISGGTVCVPTDADRSSNLPKTMLDLEITWANLTPLVADILLKEYLPCLQTLVVAGEAMTQDQIRSWANSSTHLINGYGPTEASVAATLNLDAINSVPSNIGHPVGCRVWILDSCQNLVPPGALGQLFIDGPTLARGYFGDPEKTAAAFIEPPPWLETKYPHIYMTGDLVRYSLDGSMSFVGRKDTSQVKIRGQRVEVSEVEDGVRSHLPDHGQVAVVFRKFLAGRGQLIAFIVLPGQSSEDTILEMDETTRYQFCEIRQSLLLSLPRYMVPDMFIPLTKMPLKLSGKLDRAYLRELVDGLSHYQKLLYSLAEAVAQEVAPQTGTEKTLQRLWCAVLGIGTHQVRAQSDFFKIGGDSVLAMKLTANAHNEGEMKTTNGNEQTVAPFTLIESSETDVLESVALQCGITAGQIEDLYPCTPLQEGLMALSTKQPGAYVAQYIFRVPHSIDLEHFKKAWNSTSQLHTILRTRIILQGSLMLQVVVKEATKFENHSTVDLDEFLRKNTLKTGFGARLSRFIIVQTADGGQYFVLLLHHTAFDAWSLPTLFDSVTRFYEKRLVSKPTPYNSFIDYILNDNKESMALFWATYLKALDTSHFLQLPSPIYIPSETKTVRRSISISRPSESQITTSTLLRGAWAVTLGNYSNCKDVVFCTTLSGRNTPLQGITGITGPTIATVPIRIDVDSNQSSKDFLQAIQSQTAAMIPFEQYGLQNIRRISTDAMKACDAPSLLVIQSEAEGNKDNRLLGLDPILTPVANISSYPLAIECKIGNGCVDVFGYYDDSVVSEIQMHRIQHHFEHVLRQLGEESLDLLRELSKVSSYDYNVLEKWNKEVPQVIEKCIHEITHKQAIATPDAPAVWAWDVKWSHAELDRLSSCLAYDLIHVGVKSEAIVPMCFERSGWVVVAMLGILKAGGAFLPWDPAHPEERRKEMIRQTGSEVIVTSKQTAVLCSGLAKTTFVVDPASFEGRDVELEPHKDPHTAAYVIYTSGSTGKPKGVVIEHKAYTTSAIAHGPVHRIHSKSRVAQFASYSVDAICLEIITSIMMGGCTCICSDSRRNNGLGIALNEMGVTVAALTPSVLSLMSPEELPHLETVIMVGEPAPPALVERWRIFFHLINGYGPTETSLSAVMNEKMTAAAGSNIGHAVGCVTWIADMYNHERLVPIGCIGELIIEGPTLARGYLHDEKKTSQAFVANPGWLERCGSKLYKTGDLVRYDPDGTIVFVGRKDMQVKINGHRIELGEIEHHIMRALHFVQQAVVETITTDGARVLVAILVIKDTQEMLNVRSAEACTMTPALQLHLQTLEKLLISTLPTYMVPNLWIPMNEMPFASSGKVDRKRLQELATVIWNTQRTQYALSDGTKREPMGLALELRKMWSTVLNLPVEEISADDNFFHIGADSIAAMKLAGYASKQGWELSVASIFHTPILDGMAKILVPGRRLLEEAPKPFSLLCNANIGGLFKELRSQLFDPECEIEDVMPSTDFQAWAVSYGSINAGFITYMNLIPAKELDEDRLERACRDVVASYPILRTTFVLYQNEILQVVLKYPLLHFERIKCVESIDVTWHQWFQKQKQLRLGENIIKFAFLTHKTDQRLVMRISHAQYDGISFPSIWKALSQAYAGQDIPPSRPFSTFISAITDKTDARKYWKDLLANSKMTSISSNFSPSYNRPLDQTIERTIDLPSIHPDYTLATVIKASWSIVMSHIAKESDLVFGSLVSGRSLSLDRVVGPCLNIVPVRVRLDPSCTVLELLRQIQNQQLASIPFETLGFREIAKV
ncbi:hypothetical protein BGZ57DRAFT_802778, partial [Hyaloscypha finlandica]